MKKFIIQVIKLISSSYCFILLCFYPEQVENWFIKVIGILFLLNAITYILDSHKMYLEHKIKKQTKYYP